MFSKVTSIALRVLPVLITAIFAVLGGLYPEQVIAVTAVSLVLSPLALYVLFAHQQKSLLSFNDTLQLLISGRRFAELAPDVRAMRLLRPLIATVEGLRGSLIGADGLTADRHSAKAEQRLAQQARDWFIRRFQSDAGSTTKLLNDASDRMHATATELAESSHTTSDRIAETTASASATVQAVNDVAHNIDDLVGQIVQSQHRVSQASRHAEQGVAVLARTETSVLRLLEATQQIGNVVAAIETIAGQTNMLALNATIEAARAGEAGAGFAVVAREVKDLAEQTKGATANIARQIADIQSAVQQTAGSIAEVMTAVRAVSTVTQEVDETLDRQVQGADRIRVGFQSAAYGARALGDAMPDIAAAFSRCAQAGDSILQTADALMSRANTFQQAVSAFVTDLESGAIRVGILHSLSGTMAVSETPLQQMLLMLIDQLNAAGGLLGRPLVPVILNPGSDPVTYGQQAEILLRDHKVAAIFGCWTSSSRKEVLPIVERYKGLLFYPVQFEGQEQSPNIVYTGATPNQQAIPAVQYLLDKGRRRFFLVGTDYVYPRTTNAILRGWLAAKGMKGAIEERYTDFGHREWAPIVREIRDFAAAGNAAVISTVNGDANAPFYREMARQGLTADKVPVLAFSVGEVEVAAMGGAFMQGHLVAWNYLHALDTPQTRDFISQWRAYSKQPDGVTNDPMEATWIGFQMWAEAVRRADTTQTDAVRRALAGQTVLAPCGMTVRMDQVNQHLHKPVMIGRINADRSISVLSRGETLEAPMPWSPWIATPQNTPRRGTADAVGLEAMRSAA